MSLLLGKPAGVKPNDQESVSQFESLKPDAPNEEENFELESEEIQQEVIKPNEQIEGRKKHFSYSEVERITNNFREVIGQGGSGLVYTGHLSDGIKVAVKKLSASLRHAFEQFQNEASFCTVLVFELL